MQTDRQIKIVEDKIFRSIHVTLCNLLPSVRVIIFGLTDVSTDSFTEILWKKIEFLLSNFYGFFFTGNSCMNVKKTNMVELLQLLQVISILRVGVSINGF